MKDKNNGFTLLELLAVIVIMAIVAVITIPIIIHMIENTKKGAALRSIEAYVDAVDNYIAREVMNETPIADGTYDVNGELKDNIKISKTVPSKGSFTIANSRVTGAQLCISDYSADYDGKSASMSNNDYCSVTQQQSYSLIEQLPTVISTSTDTEKFIESSTTNVYDYVGAKGLNDSATNWLWYGGHLWRIMQADKTNNRLTLITSYPVVNLKWNTAVTTNDNLENSDLGKWLNDVFYASLNSAVKDNMLTMEYSRRTGTNDSGETGNTKIRLLTRNEYLNNQSSNSSYLNIDDKFWLADSYGTSKVLIVKETNTEGYDVNYTRYGVRPVIQINSINYISGTGKYNDPYIAQETKATKTSDINIGEYVSVPKSDGGEYLVRVIKKDDGIKVSLNGMISESVAYGNCTYCNKLDKTYPIYTETLTNFKSTFDTNYFDSIDHYYSIGSDAGNNDYTVSRCFDASVNNCLSIDIALPSIYEMFSGNDLDLIDSTTKTFVDYTKILNSSTIRSFWFLNMDTSVNIFYSNRVGAIYSYGLTNSLGVRPVWYIKDVDIKSGSGTAYDPYKLK